MAEPFLRILRKALLVSICLVAPSMFGLVNESSYAIASQPSHQDPATPIQVRVKLDRLPRSGQTALATCSATTAREAGDTSIDLILPSNVQLVSGNLHWYGTLRPSSPTTLSATVSFQGSGNVKVTCKAYHQVDSKNSWGDLDSAYLSIGASRSEAGFGKIGIPYGGHLGDGTGVPSFTPVNPEVFAPSNASVVPQPPPVIPSRDRGASSPRTNPQAPAGTLTITGRWAYYDRSGTFVGANQFLVELVQGDGTHLTWCYTDVNGYYSCGPVTNPGSAGMRTYLRSYISYNPYSDVLQVVYSPCGTGIFCTYPTQTGMYTFGDGTYDIGSWNVIQGNNYEGAYWLKDDLDRAWKFVWFGTGSAQSPQETAGPGTILWSVDSTDGTYYNTGGQIHLRGEDRLAPDVSIHEYGHNVMYNLYQWWPITNCPSPHYIQLYSGPNCSWTEGWANYFALAVNGDPVFNWPSGAALNLETPTWGTPNWDNGDGVEGRVAGGLWDIYDGANDGYDQFTDGFANIWDTIFHQTDNNFSEYWSAWKQRGHNQSQAVMSIYQNTIDYRVSGPANDDFNNAIVINGTPFSHSEDTTYATTAGDDPSYVCGSRSQGSASVWYSYTPSSNGQLDANTIGSNYDTMLAMWTGSRGSLNSVACDDDSGGSQTSALSANLTGGMTYYFEVARYTSGLAPVAQVQSPSGGGGSMQLSISFTPSGQPPTTPSNPSPSDGSTVDRTTSITFYWSTSGANQCLVHIWGGPNYDSNLPWSSNCSSLFWGQQWPGAYQWQVFSNNSNGTTTGPIWHLYIKPYAPTNLSASAGSQTQINLSWTKSSDDPGSVDNYKVYYTNGTYITTLSSGTTNYTVGSLTCGSSYSFYVTAVRQGVESNASNTATATTSSCSQPPANDDFNSAKIISVMPYLDNMDSTNATSASDDPLFACGNRSQGSASVWYRFSPSSNGRLSANTIGSNYDTMLEVWRGTRGSLISMACDDDSGGNLASSLQVNLIGGTTYYIEIARYTAGLAPAKINYAPTVGGGSLRLSISFGTNFIYFPLITR